MTGLILGLVIAFLVAAVVIWIVGKLGLGMEVSGFGGAIIAAVVIAIVSAVVVWLLGLIGITTGNPGLWGAIVTLVVSAVVLLIADRFVTGLRVNGFVGAIIAAIAIGVVNWILFWLLGLLGIA
jgi:putative membrane protein